MKFFVSHSTLDNDLVKQIVSVFDEYEIKVWVDYEQVKKGDELIREINNALKDSNYFLLVWTQNADKSSWVQKEMAAALERGDKLRKIVFKLDNTEV
jgi:hypothetical protein